MSRKIKDIKDKHTGELVYPRTHISAVVLSSDSTLEDLVEVKQDKINDLDEIRTGAAKGATALQSVPSEYVTETELSNKGYATISALNNKVDVINGKQLSTEDFTTALKNKLEGLNNYDDTELSEAIETLRGDFDNIVSGDTTTAIKTFNEVIAFLDGLTDTQDLESIIASIEQQIAGKADDNSVVHKSGEETITGTKTFNGRVNFLGSGDSNAMYLSTNTRLNVDGTTNTVLGFSSGTFLINNAAYNLTLRGKGTRPTYNSTTLALSSDIPAAVTENTVSGWGFTKNTGTYSKPSGGIPKSDLASAVQTSLGKADTALQSYTEQYKGTVTGVKINGTTKNPSSGIVDLGTVITAHQTLKTINGESIVGSGDITISGGSSGANVQAVDTGDVLDDVTVDYATTAYVDGLVGDINSTIGDINSTIGDINSVLESIINGGGNASQPDQPDVLFPITLSHNTEGNETYAKVYAELDKISNKNLSSVPIDNGLIYIDLTTFAIGINEKSYEVSHIVFEGNNTYSLGTIENGPEIHTILLNSDGAVWNSSQ